MPTPCSMHGATGLAASLPSVVATCSRPSCAIQEARPTLGTVRALPRSRVRPCSAHETRARARSCPSLFCTTIATPLLTSSLLCALVARKDFAYVRAVEPRGAQGEAVGSYWLYNDARVSRASARQALHAEASILVYERLGEGEGGEADALDDDEDESCELGESFPFHDDVEAPGAAGLGIDWRGVLRRLDGTMFVAGALGAAIVALVARKVVGEGGAGGLLEGAWGEGFHAR